MASDFDEKTLFVSKNTEQRMKQSLEAPKLNDDEGKQKLSVECDNQHMAEEQQ